MRRLSLQRRRPARHLAKPAGGALVRAVGVTVRGFHAEHVQSLDWFAGHSHPTKILVVGNEDGL